jgi:hypothetical protein
VVILIGAYQVSTSGRQDFQNFQLTESGSDVDGTFAVFVRLKIVI